MGDAAILDGAGPEEAYAISEYAIVPFEEHVSCETLALLDLDSASEAASSSPVARVHGWNKICAGAKQQQQQT